MRICFLGGGNMAKAMISGLVKSSFNPKNITVIDRNIDKLEALYSEYMIEISKPLSEAIAESEVIILAIKPQQMGELIKSIKNYVSSSHLIISVAAGIQVAIYAKLFGKDIALARAIPNTPSSLGYGATGIYFNDSVDAKQKNIVINIMSSMGITVVVDTEYKIDVIAACASSGPAYYLQFMEYMIESAVKNGLARSQASILVLQTCLGTAHMALNSGDSIEILRESITSKKGITSEALKIFEESNLRGIVDKAIKANIKRSKELTNEFDGIL
ncbi:pyrroline-5-carboxylate reductase [Allofrancisella guangzhouensis]|uniref:Pyrroline-5-carboxylate reductase n=1 Tax=Allofrancisella guangzhouensis TaxID=594679 RepID=A0A0A8E6M5_9GAMM|nr:pyrroline-5-carboxylate reductase [Allofrancisella guangzhouensis]AJC49579.1 pyrroline-5-carboxylate reductase [Allofrancisella guangzhouensis]MBK2026987.1 pyrroline-5-carboxylate reductase [Allofrancisella guangzhouensis]MBK2043895.1 pyrroline-5-carboxylate reductase [Allofrancisella guangzhouensis]MBK2044992.1 pyrroline-5-carboxylate reductase [Allofrancisella guangzhouensis]